MSETPSPFKLWFEYDHYANSKVLAIIESNVGGLPDDTLKLFSHIIAAHEIWNTRITNTPRKLKVWDRIPISEMTGWLSQNLENTISIVQKMEDSGIVEYENTSGARFSNNIPDIMFHILTHSHYHRGQIARNMRENNIEPAETNYIGYRR